MARVTAEEVKEILDDDITIIDSKIEAFILGANAMVSEVLTGKGLSTAILKEIERWTTAHFIASTLERMAAKEGAGGASITYTGKYEKGFDLTSYGQTAISLDTSGTLASLGGKSARISAIETE